MTNKTPESFYAGLPRKRVVAGALITDASGRVLVVEQTYRTTCEVPGGVVEASETAPAACARECREELGIDVAVGRLLVTEHQTEDSFKGDSIMYIYDGAWSPTRERSGSPPMKSEVSVSSSQMICTHS